MRIRMIQSLQLLVIFFLCAATLAVAQIQWDRPKSAQRLPNPMILSAPRDELLTLAKQVLETREIPIEREDCNSNNGECTLISKPIIFIKGIQTRSQLEHYAEVPAAKVRSWSKGRYVLRIQISPASPSSAQVGVYAKFEGMSESLGLSEWVPMLSKGEMENLLLLCLQNRLQGGDCSTIYKN